MKTVTVDEQPHSDLSGCGVTIGHAGHVRWYEDIDTVQVF